jgi:peptidoglycan/LPS O-acetylase OafA/YrhL
VTSTDATSSPTARPQSRSASLDILRLIAVVLVLGRHMETYPLEFGKGLTFYVTRLWQNGGWTGVDLFFVLSGFLIGGLLFAEVKKTNGLRVGRFLLRRGLKIYPAFYVLLLATFAFNLAFHRPMRPKSVIAEVFFLQNYLGGLWNHTWSLAVEEHFYIGLPLLLLVLLRISRPSEDPFRWIPWITGLVVVTCLCLRVHLALTQGFDNLIHLFPTHLRIDSLLIGVAIAYAYHFHRHRLLAWSRRWQIPLLIGGTVLFLPAFYFPLGSHWWLHSIALTGFAFGAAMILIALVEREPPPWRIVRWASYLGSHSYSIYLWHAVIAVFAAKIWTARSATAGASSWYLYFVAYIAASLGVGLAMAALIEFPILALRDREAPATAAPLSR